MASLLVMLTGFVVTQPICLVMISFLGYFHRLSLGCLMLLKVRFQEPCCLIYILMIYVEKLIIDLSSLFADVAKIVCYCYLY
jgi:hypothetical protein